MRYDWRALRQWDNYAIELLFLKECRGFCESSLLKESECDREGKKCRNSRPVDGRGESSGNTQLSEILV